ncbi:MAG: Crp/Fnr family transcriptional regulator [Flavobacteriales bacterium]|nr:Crp/Fnr family transcriptional regulator [Flavobacteriales bacterium]
MISKNCISEKDGCVNCLKKRFSLLNKLSEAELQILNSNRKSYNIKRGKSIYNIGEKPKGLICLSQGQAKISVGDEFGNLQIVSLKKKVDFLGFHELMSKSNYSTTATAINDVDICIIDKKDFFSVVTHNNDFSMKIIKQLAKDLQNTEKRTIKLTQKHMRSRLAETILELVEIYGFVKNEKGLINVELKRKEFANISNMTTANAIRTMSAFVKEGIIKTERRKVWILDSIGLKKIQEEKN